MRLQGRELHEEHVHPENISGSQTFRKRSVGLWTVIVIFSFFLLEGCAKRTFPKLSTEELTDRLIEVSDTQEQRLEISWLGVPRQIRGEEGSWIERNLEKQFNIDLKPIFLEWLSYKRRKPLMMLGGEIPDVYWVESSTDLRRDAHHGFALELPYEVILKHAPNYVEALNKYAPEAWLLSYYKGGNYGLPTFGALENGVLPQPGVWRIDWLRNVGIEKIPETLDEMHDALWKFRHEDPDGNGRMDTYGMSPKAGLSQKVRIDHSFGEIYGAFGVLSAGWVEQDGHLIWGGILPETKKVLAILKRWYAEGLIYPEYLLVGDDPNERFYLFTRGKVGYMPAYAHFDSYDHKFSGSLAGLMSRLHPEANYYPPGNFPAGPKGKRGGPIIGGAENVVVFGAHLALEPEKVVRILRMFNKMASDVNLHLQAKIGKRDVHWSWSIENGINGLPPFDDPFYGSRELVGINPTISHAISFFCPFGARKEWLEHYNSNKETDFDQTYRRAELSLKSPIPWPDMVPLAEKFYADLRVFQETVFAEIIQGNRELEEFDEFVKEWFARGGLELTEDANRMLKVKDDVFRQVGAVQGESRADLN